MHNLVLIYRLKIVIDTDKIIFYIRSYYTSVKNGKPVD